MNTAAFRSEIEHVWIAMPDGVRLSARIWLPREWVTSSEAVPAIFEYIPYRKRDMVRARDERNHPVFAANGYAALRIDMRGSGDSEGVMTDMYTPDELADAHHVIEWITRQDWCNGRVGMVGTSWGGTSALQTAWGNDSGHLSAIIAVCATNDRYHDDIHHMGGCLLTDSLEWGATLPAILALPGDSDDDPEKWGANWQERLDNIPFPLEPWIEHEANDDYWKWGSVTTAQGRPNCPVLCVGGWSDRYSNSVMNVLADNPRDCWGIVGPWGHHYPDHGCPGPGMDFQGLAIRWWDHWLKDADNGVDSDPRLRVWCNEFKSPANYWKARNGNWISAQHWPSADVIDSEVELTRPPSGLGQSVIRIPNNLAVGQAAGDTGYFGRPGGLPLDQRSDDAGSLTWESEPFDEPCLILGKPVVSFDCIRDRQISTVVVRLCDLSPDGGVGRIGYGVRNLALDANAEPEQDQPTEVPRAIRMELPNLCYRINPGIIPGNILWIRSHLRLLMTSSIYFIRTLHLMPSTIGIMMKRS